MRATARADRGFLASAPGKIRERLATPRDRLAFAIGVSLLLHLVLLSTRFVAPSLPAARTADPALAVVLLQSGSDRRPLAPEVSAQVDSVGGSESAADRAQVVLVDRAAREAPPSLPGTAGFYTGAIAKADARAYASEASGVVDASQAAHASDASGASDAAHASDDVAVLTARLQARIDRQISDYNNRPKRLTFGIDAVGTPYARYVAHWAEQIERIGTDRYPPEARGKLYDSLILTVEIDRNGKVVNVVIDQPSRHEALNRAARRIVHAGEPYPAFSAEMAREGDILQITRTWTFARNALATASLQPAASLREVAP